MTRSLVGIAAAAVVTVIPTVIAAQPTQDPRVTVSRGSGQVTISVKAATLVVAQQVTPTTFDLTVADGRDVARFTGDVDGRVRIERGGRMLALAMTNAKPEDAATARTMLAGSIALERFGRLMASSWARATKEAVVFASAHAIVALVQGNAAPLHAFVQRVRVGAEPRLVTVAQMSASECWRSYERDVLGYTYELESCLVESSDSLNPLRSAWCAYSYNLKATLAFIWLLDCSGY